MQEAERRERVAQKALESAARSKLPPRMQQHKESQRAKRAAEAERIQTEIDAELTLQPRITQEIPDFDRLHANFERELARKRNTFRGTTPRPFRMESEPYRMMQRETKQVKDEMIQRDIRRDELVMPERRWPYLSTQAPVGRKEIPDFNTEHKVWRAKTHMKETTEKLEAHKEKIRQGNPEEEAALADFLGSTNLSVRAVDPSAAKTAPLPLHKGGFVSTSLLRSELKHCPSSHAKSFIEVAENFELQQIVAPGSSAHALHALPEASPSSNARK